MFSTIRLASSALLVLAVFPCSALQITSSQVGTSGAPTTITWVNEVNDPSTWSFYLINEAFHDNFGLANNVDPVTGSLTINLPTVPARGGYTWQAVDISNVKHVYATSGTFSIDSASSSTSSSTMSSSVSTSVTMAHSTMSTPTISTLSRSANLSSTGSVSSSASPSVATNIDDDKSKTSFNGAISPLDTVSTAMVLLGAAAGPLLFL